MLVGGCKLFFPPLPRARNRRIKPVQSKTGSLAIFGILGFLRGVGARLRQPGRARLILLPSADSLLTRLGSGIRTLTHVRRTGPARADGRNCESGTLTGTECTTVPPNLADVCKRFSLTRALAPEGYHRESVCVGALVSTWN